MLTQVNPGRGCASDAWPANVSKDIEGVLQACECGHERGMPRDGGGGLRICERPHLPRLQNALTKALVRDSIIISGHPVFSLCQ